MKIKPLLKYTNETDFLKDYLIAHGVDESKIEDFIHPEEDIIKDGSLYRNMEDACLRLDIAVGKKEKIGVLVDSDADGNTSAAILYSFLRDTLGFAPKYFLHTGKQHGLRPTPDENLVGQIAEANIDLLFIPDAGSEDASSCKILKQEHNCDTVVLDHHKFNKPNTWAIVVNNQTGGQEANKNLSGCGVTAKFIGYYCQSRGYETPYLNDMVATSLVSDSMNLSNLENRAYVYYGLNDLQNPLLELMAQKMNRRGNTPDGFSFGLIPPINALQRSSNQADKALFFEALTGQGDLKKAISVARKAHRTQMDIVKTMTQDIEPTLDMRHKAIIGFTDADNKEYIGLVANKFLGLYGKPTILLREADSTHWSGSLRSPIPIKDIINETKLATCQGHDGACGIILKKSNLPKLIKFLDTLPLEVEPVTEVACELKPKQITRKLCGNIESNELMWGKGLPKPMFYVRNKVNINDIQIYQKKTTTVKLTIDGVNFMLFNAKDEDVKKLTEHTEYNIEMLVDAKNNEYNGFTYPQANIQKFEVNPIEYKEEDWEDLF